MITLRTDPPHFLQFDALSYMFINTKHRILFCKPRWYYGPLIAPVVFFFFFLYFSKLSPLVTKATFVIKEQQEAGAGIFLEIKSILKKVSATMSVGTLYWFC